MKNYVSNFDEPLNEFNNYGLFEESFSQYKTMPEVVIKSTKKPKKQKGRGLDLDTRAGNLWKGLKGVFSKKDKDDNDDDEPVKKRKTTRRTSNAKILADIQPSDASNEKLPLLQQKMLMNKIIEKATGISQTTAEDVKIPQVQREQTMQDFYITANKKDNTLLYIAAGGGLLLLMMLANKKK